MAAPGAHGRKHSPDGEDTLEDGPWHNVGATDDVEFPDPVLFQNGWGNQGGGKMDMRFRKLLGIGYEIQGSVTGGDPGTVVFSLPVGYYDPGGEIRLTAVKDDNTIVVLRIAPATGPARADVYYDEPA
jgi:hypothetical protein